MAPTACIKITPENNSSIGLWTKVPLPLASSKTSFQCQKAKAEVGHMFGFSSSLNTIPILQVTGLPYYYLGRVPCRSVSLVGIIVGVSEYERRILYILDDGTGTIECAFRTDQGLPENEASEDQGVPTLVREPTHKPMLPSSSLVPVGSVVKVQGRVRAKQNSRDIYGESIEQLRGPCDELNHWRQVTTLHKNYYSLPGPFVIPSSSATASGSRDTPRTPKSAVPGSFPSASTPSAHSTTSSSSVSSSIKLSEDPSRPVWLRHPSRLRSRDLTENTFRIYVKHFMDNLRHLNFGPQSHDSDLDSDVDSVASAITPETPTKGRSAPCHECTPRLSRRANNPYTPRPQSHPASHAERYGYRDGKEAVIGCTLSFLIRVPELANLARRVVEAEARRREKTRKSQSTAANPDRSGKRKALASSAEGSTPKFKRLFSWAIRKLYQDGSIILWDGPALSVSKPYKAPDSSMLYRSSPLDDTAHSRLLHRPRSQNFVLSQLILLTTSQMLLQMRKHMLLFLLRTSQRR
ncbi:hypothetical protein B0F90DRAFT_506900 [Multifurca ochricompacta]|uniref:CST complex subunit STN1 n=1 Tax=Multifurca ochricompacta TaxID=376703 RepID=A0AAD4MDD8_9AGAM|nr:hypothetical protein B0F90DRAFT_506900 [Multifurca ochricompacta]